GILSDDAGKTIAKLETWVFCPALSFITMAKYCTVKSLSTHSINVIFACFVVFLSLIIAIPLARAFTKKNKDDRGVYEYALAVANFGYMGDSVVLSMFGSEFLSFYKLFTLPGTIVIYAWGIGRLVPKGDGKGSFIKSIINAPMVAMILGIIVGLTGLGNHLPIFVESTFNTLSACMGPIAMLLAGFTMARFNILNMLKDKKVYIATLFRLIIIPTAIIAALFGIKELAGLIFNKEFDNSILYLTFFYVATPFGLNTIVFPEAYGKSPKTGASMALISHILCIITIPLLYTLMKLIFN
ncbi:MAG: AEC family transporter, partial [Clostridia bacterium]|nr:AEC family transporter [Clostridia bacterium]